MQGALSLTAEQVATRQMAIVRLHAVVAEMTFYSGRLAEHRLETTIAHGPLAEAARIAWGKSQAALIQADAGMVCERMVDSIAKRGDAPEPLRRLALSCLTAAERRLYGQAPRPVERDAGERR